jgi:hypothetical protein
MKTALNVAALLAAGMVACGDKAPPPSSPPKPKVEAVKNAESAKSAIDQATRK